MLRELLNASPDLWMSEVESHFIPKFTRTIDRYGDLATRAGFDRLTAALRATRAFWQWEHRGVHVPDDEWWAACPRHDWPGVVAGLFHCVHRREVASPPKPWDEIVWGDKTPVYMGELALLASLFPAARFVHIVRDPRDCVLSTESAWGNSRSDRAGWADQRAALRTDGARSAARFLRLLRGTWSPTWAASRARVRLLGVPVRPTPGGSTRARASAARGAGRRGKRRQVEGRHAGGASPGIRSHSDLIAAYGYEREHPATPTRSLSRMRLVAYRFRDAWLQLRFRRRELGSWVEAVRFLMAR
jgi:hypothetical protein